VARVRAHYRLPRRYILSVGTLEPRKNLPALLRAFDQLRARDGSPAAALDLVIVGGRGWRDRSLRAELARRLDEGRVHSLGYVPESDLVALYGGAEVMAYPSHFEGFGLPVLESMACGTPVVASDVAALHEVSGGAAVLVRPNDETALAAAIAELVEDAAARSALRARGLARAAEFRWERTAESLWAFARTVHRRLHGRRAPAASAPAPGAVAAEAPPPPSPAGAPPRGADERDWAILATVAYADLFEAAIPVDDAAHACLGCRLSTEEVRGRVTAEPLARFVTLGATGYLTLRRREHLGARRAEGIRRTAELLDRHRRVIAALASLPFIRMLALSGGTAHRNARGGDDIDLFVVAAAGRAYTAYTLLFLASQLTRTRGIVCPNYLVDEEHLRIAYNHDLFTAHQAISLVPVAGTDTFARFLEANDAWVSAFYPNYQPRSAASAPPGMPRLQRALERAAAALGDRAEHLLSAAWRIHLGRRAAAKGDGADVVLEAGILKLHLSDHRRRVLGRFEARLAGLRREWEAGQPADPETPALPHTPVPTAR
jgi:hypothetical protein